jgi:hypothetical protein
MKIILYKIFRKINTLAFSLYQKNVKKYIKLSSKPFITGDTFRSQSNHILDDTSNIDHKRIKKGEMIFVKTDYLNKFLKLYLSELPDEIVLVTHNSDINITNNPFGNKLSEKSIHWFAQNLEIDITLEPFIHPLPIGFENRNWLKNGKLSVLRNVNIKDNKKNKIFCAFNTSTNKERIKILHHLDLNNNVKYFRRASHKIYMDTLSEYKVSICPPGNGVDTHRIWESLLVETLPIVEKSSFTENLFSLGVPLLLINSWDELAGIDENYIADAYSKNLTKLREQRFTENLFWMSKLKEVF